MLPTRGPRRRLGMNTFAAAKEPGRNHTIVIQDDEFVTAKQVWKIHK
jgi:hypothetical protein